MSAPIRLLDIYAARRRLRDHLTSLPLRTSAWLSALTGGTTLLALESLQPTGSFKVRGALNAALRLMEAGNPPTIVTASAGNHGRAIAFAAELLKLHAVVFTPAAAPRTKKDGIRRHGAELRDDAPDFDAAERAARAFAASSGAAYVSPYNHVDVIAGNGTVALDVLDTRPALDAIVVPVGGGGLISGIGIALKRAAPSVRVIGVEVDASRPFSIGFMHGRITPIEVKPSLADGLVGNLEAGSMTFELVRDHVDQLVSVDEDDLRAAMRGLAAEEHLIVEGAGAAATAAVLRRNVVGRGERAVVLVTGANIDLPRFLEVAGSG